jgi:hypothetical protein
MVMTTAAAPDGKWDEQTAGGSERHDRREKHGSRQSGRAHF